MDKARVLRFIKSGLLIFAVMFAMVWVKTYFAGHAQYVEGEKNYQTNNLKDAITSYETAIHMYTPFSGYVPASAERLWEIGQGFERSGDYDWALIAYRSLRSSFYAVRSFYTPYQEWIDRSEKQIDLVLAAKQQQEMAARPGPAQKANP